jgi:alpha-beta hydrolase superfamily lysophospholipase
MRFSEDRIEKLTCSDGVERDIHIWEPENPRVIFLTIHGGMDHGGNYVEPGLYFRKHQMATVAHDQHGHDHKEKVYIPRFEVFLDDMELMVEWVKNEYKDVPIFILAHSMGSLVATHYGLKKTDIDPQIKGFILSSPYYVNVVRVPWIMLKMVGILSAVAPRMSVPMEDIRPNVTHDEAIYRRHCRDVEDNIMAGKASARFASELLKAQRWVPEHIARWNHPVLAIIAGDDKLADADASRELIGKIDRSLVTEQYYPDNFHENFNELNREEVFARIVEWVNIRI